jgi:transcriptional regulator with XRE-family HTH domain
MTIGDQIRRKRKDMGLSQRALGKLIGVSGSAVSQWENDQIKIDPDNQVIISKIMSIPITEFMPPGSLDGDTLIKDDREKLLIARFRVIPRPLQEAFLHMLHVQAQLPTD